MKENGGNEGRALHVAMYRDPVYLYPITMASQLCIIVTFLVTLMA